MALRSRREEYSEASRQALIESARRQFGSAGFTATSLDDIALQARLTKGAVYHHFATKQALFEVVLTEIESETVAAITEATRQANMKGVDPWTAALAGLDAFLERCLDPVYQRICFLEGPLALGFTAWWAAGEKNEIGLIHALFSNLRAAGLVETADIDTLTSLMYGALVSAALAIARSEEPVTTRDRVREVVIRTIWGLRPVKSSEDC